MLATKLQAHRTDKWDGWTRCNIGNGSAFLTASIPLPYSRLTPKVAETENSSLGLWAAIIAAVVAVVTTVLVLILRRRRGNPAMEE